MWDTNVGHKINKMLTKPEISLLRILVPNERDFDKTLGELNISQEELQKRCLHFINKIIELNLFDDFLFKTPQLKKLFPVECSSTIERFIISMFSTFPELCFSIKTLDVGVKGIFEKMTPAIVFSKALPANEWVNIYLHELLHLFEDNLKGMGVSTTFIAISLFEKLKDYVLEDRIIETLISDFEKVKQNGNPKFVPHLTHSCCVSSPVTPGHFSFSGTKVNSSMMATAPMKVR